MNEAETRLTAYFVIEDDSDSGQEVSVSEVLEIAQRPTFIIGSHPRSHLQLEDPDVAMGHAVVTLEDGAYRVESRFPDLDTLVNGERIDSRIVLTPGDRVQVGETTLRFCLEERAVTTIAPLPRPAPARAAKPSAPAAPPLVRIESPIPTTAVAVEAAPAPKIYRPQQTGGSRANIPLILLAVVAIVGMVGMALGGLGGIGGAQQAARPDFEFVYDDGNVTVAMFYADW